MKEGVIMKKARHKKCSTVVKKETSKGLRKEYPFYCPKCDENLYRFETYKKK